MSNNENPIESFGDISSSSPKRRSRCEEGAEPTSVEGENETEQEKLYKVIKLVQWAVCGVDIYKPVADTSHKLTPGIYNIMASQEHGIIFKKKEICVDDLLMFPDSLSDKIMKEITHFWASEDSFNFYGFLHRRGYMLYGPAGSGKTCLVHQIMADIVNSGGIVFQCDNHPAVFSSGLQLFRQVEPHRPVVCLFEDLDAIIDSSSEDNILSLLDGENQINRVLNVATTNYPERLDKRLVARPRRFDRVIKVDMPTPEVRELYFRKKLKLNDGDELSDWVKVSDRFSFAALAELVISVKCFGKSLKEASDNLRNMLIEKVSSSQYNELKGNVGFGQ
jgi:AAA+ superfamily predicted ATPase